MTDDPSAADIQEWADQITKDVYANMAQHGKAAEELAKEMSKPMLDKSLAEVAIAITLIRCYLDDMIGSPTEVGFTLEIIHDYVRRQMDANRGNPQ